jgi:glutamate--cysteine ligase catalytic subunit
MGRRGKDPSAEYRSGLLTYTKIEYLVVAIDDEQQKVRLSLCQAEVLKALARDEELGKHDVTVPDLQDVSG